MADIEFSGGDEILQPFLIDVNGVVADLTGSTVTGEIWWRNALRLQLTQGAGLSVINLYPSLDPLDQIPHGIFRVTEAQSAEFPVGRIAYIRYKIVNSDGVTMSTGPTYFNRIL